MRKILVEDFTLIKDKDSKDSTYIYLDFYEDYMDLIGLDIEYEDLDVLARYNIINVWFNFNNDMSKGILRISVEPGEIEYSKEDTAIINELNELVEKYKLTDMAYGYYLDLQADINGRRIYNCEQLYNK